MKSTAAHSVFPSTTATTVNEHRARTAPLRWFAAMPIALLKDPSVAAESKVLAGLLLSYDGPRGCFPKISSLMKDTGSSKHTVIRSLEELERYGFLTRERRGRNNIYHLTPAYVQPARPDDIALTGELAIENARPAKPVKRKLLHNRRPDPVLPLDTKQVAPEQPIPIRGQTSASKRVAPVQPIVEAAGHESVASGQPGVVASVQRVTANGLHRSNLDISDIQNRNYIQQQQDAAASEKPNRSTIELVLITAGVAPQDAVPWAMDLEGLDTNDVLAALKIMRAKPAYRRREISRPGAYMRVLINTQVHQDRQLAAHEALKSRPAPTEAMLESETVVKADVASNVEARIVKPQPVAEIEQEGPSISEQLDSLDIEAADRVRARAAQLCSSGPESPAWPAALSIAYRQVLQ